MENQNQDVTTLQADVPETQADTVTPQEDVPATQADTTTPKADTDATKTPGKAASSRDEALAKLVEDIQDARTKDYVKNRLLKQMKWYSKKSGECKQQYHYLMFASIILGALIPVFSLLLSGPLWVQFAIAAFGSVVTAINAYLSLHNSKDLWLTYRNTREILLRTLYFYFNDAEEFSKKTQEEKNELLIETCEAEMARENGTWYTMFHDGKVTKHGGS